MPIRRKVRQLLDVKPRRRVPPGTVVEMWIGISYDEIERMRTAEDVWQENRYPLIEAGMSRHDCVRWWADNAPADAPELARSACVICPYHSDREWLRLQDEHPNMIEAAAQAEAGLRARQEERGYGHIEQYLHVRRVPLIEALDTAREADERQPSMFGNECEGLCGAVSSSVVCVVCACFVCVGPLVLLCEVVGLGSFGWCELSHCEQVVP